MYEHLEALLPAKPEAFHSLTPMGMEKVEQLRSGLPGLPESYWVFLAERGHGLLMSGPFHFFTVFEGPMDAAAEYYGDEQIYEVGSWGEPGAAGPVWLFGATDLGEAYGFDTGADFRMIKTDHRDVERLDLTFDQFIDGLCVCFPQFPERYLHGTWFDSLGRAYPRPGT